MDPGIAAFILIIIAMVMVTAIVTTWIQSRAPAKKQAGETGASPEIELLSSENAGLRGQIRRLEERLAVLERIATDPAERTARQIEQLRQG
jgi:flagellar biosynthesis/type III secretory pathway M-ring protein FliF/YscJ